ncbi:helix-turn-helix transcriptional regulator [Haloarcula onubensis]|uniref:ArsR family transcriptional regulator n=1 Tax=Haloarcula onubensis TaxID=2950539 RepID=A0ABU2FQR1_9EURY|nr:ArsR family transcriptional regulator [Halomicroarcula sp. S3CR25-11]MDS0283098.1 ArsR family transcriptional regulator [Halomicroarcula sp. S3CR25-11]
MEETLAEIEFLALSPNRVQVLESLAAGPHGRSELADVTGASQATLGRILSDFEDRDWVVRSGGKYAATATGRLVAEGFRDLLDVMAAERELRDVVAYLPTEAMDFDLRHLADASIVTPSETRPNAPLQRLLERIREAESVTAFSHALNDQSLAVVADRLGDQEFEAVLTRSAVDSLTADDALRDRLRRVVAAPSAGVRVADGDIPVAVTIADDVVNFLVRDDRGVVQAAVDTTHPAVREWAERRYEHYRVNSVPLTADELAD